MVLRITVRLSSVCLGLLLVAPAAIGYIHFSPMTLPKMCKESHQIRLLKIDKLDKEKGVILFEMVTSLKGVQPQIDSFKHKIRIDAEKTKPILDWAKEGKTAVMFSIEAKRGDLMIGIGYVFIDEYCYTVDYNSAGKYWLMIRAEPGMSACYHGSVKRLREAVKDTLEGKAVKVPVKVPDAKDDFNKRYKEINDVISEREKNR